MDEIIQIIGVKIFIDIILSLFLLQDQNLYCAETLQVYMSTYSINPIHNLSL